MATFFGPIGQRELYNTKDNPDVEALKRDWAIVGRDLYAGIEQYRQETKPTDEK